MRYYYLKEDVYVPGRWHLIDLVDEKDERVDLEFRAVPYRRGPLSITVDPDGGARAVDYSESLGAPIAKRELVQAMMTIAPQDIQAIPVSIAGHPGYEALNALRAIDCIDRARSAYREVGDENGSPDYRGLDRIVVDPAKVPSGLDIFRVLGWWVNLLVSERMKEKMESVGCLGAKFQTASCEMSREPFFGPSRDPWILAHSKERRLDTLRREAWTPRFQRLFEQAGLRLEDDRYLLTLPGRRDPQPGDYRRAICERLQLALRTKRGAEATKALLAELTIASDGDAEPNV